VYDDAGSSGALLARGHCLALANDTGGPVANDRDAYHGAGGHMPTSRQPQQSVRQPPSARSDNPSRRQSAEYLQAVADVAQATVDSRDPGEVFRLIARLARTLSGAASSTIGTLGPGPTSLTIHAAEGASSERLRVGTPVSLGGTLMAHVVRTGKSLVVPGPESAAEPFRTILLRFNLGPAMCVPLVAHGRVFGASSE
jgi:hypothetical protein